MTPAIKNNNNKKKFQIIKHKIIIINIDIKLKK
jgi:hypothetical protein